jgi:hypothetical protein
VLIITNTILSSFVICFKLKSEKLSCQFLGLIVMSH